MHRTDGFNPLMRRLVLAFLVVFGVLGCSKFTPIPESEYQKTDVIAHQVLMNIADEAILDEVAVIDHSRLANQKGSRLAPTQLILFHNKALEAQLLKLNPLVAMELPIKLLIYLEPTHDEVKLVWNDFTYISRRYHLGLQAQLAQQYEESLVAAIKGVDQSIESPLTLTRIDESALITLSSPMNFESSLKRAVNIARDNKDVIIFDLIDFQKVARDYGVVIPKMTLVLFGAPGPGGRAMKASQSLGLDGFPQKVLVWNDSQGNTHVTYNELLLLATRHKVPVNTALRVIQRRMDKAFKRSFHH